MTQGLAERVRDLDDLTAVKLLRHVGSILFKEPQVRALMESFRGAGDPLADLASLSAARKQETLTSAGSIWLTRALLLALASDPRFAVHLAQALKTLRRDELVAEATVPRGLATELVRLLAATREQKVPSGGPSPDPLAHLAQAAMGMEAPPISASGTRLAVAPHDHALVRVYFGTDRNDTGSEVPAKRFGSKRSSTVCGTCEVSIPRDHRMGALEAPSVWKLEFRANPDKHVVLMSVATQPEKAFFAGLRQRVSASAHSSAFIFVHGYNVSFEDAARRTAQISYDLGFDGAPIFWSWPSKSTVLGYTVDEASIEWSTGDLQRFLAQITENAGIKNLYLIAHSMGNRALARAVVGLLGQQEALVANVREVILTAPDIDAGVFRQDIAPALAAGGRPVTLYASSEDLALAASKKVHGYPRAGDSGDGLVVVNGIETIDATAVDTSLMGHSYFAESRSVLSDIFYLIGTGNRAADRFALRPMETNIGRYWAFRK